MQSPVAHQLENSFNSQVFQHEPSGSTANRHRPSIAARRKSTLRSSPYPHRPYFSEETEQQKPAGHNVENLESGGKCPPFVQSPQEWLSDSSHSRSNSVSSVSSANSSPAWSDVDSFRIPVYTKGDHPLFNQNSSIAPGALDGTPAPFISPEIPNQYESNPSSPFFHSHSPQTSKAPSGVDLDPYLSNYAKAIRTVAGSNTTTERAKITFVHKWLVQSFILHPEGSVSRQALYASYIHTCDRYGIQPINAASYGKAVRSCWPGIKTRRLGVRGSSRYHYCGIRPATQQVENLVNGVSLRDVATGNLNTGTGSAHDSDSSISHSGNEGERGSAPMRLPEILTSTFTHGKHLAKQELEHQASSASDLSSASFQPPDLHVNESTIRLKRQISAPSLASPRLVSGWPEFSFPDLKTPTARHFFHDSPYHNHNQVSASSLSFETDGNSVRARNRRATFPALSIHVPAPASSIPLPPSNPQEAGNNLKDGQHVFQFKLPQELCIILPSAEEVFDRVNPKSREDLDTSTAEYVWSVYRDEHCQRLLQIVAKAHYDEFEAAFMLFWHSLDSHHYKVIQHPLLSVALYRADVAVYDAILTYLNNHAFLPMEPHIRSALRRLGLNLEHCAALALQSFPQHVKGCRIELASRTAHLLSRHVDIVEHSHSLSALLTQRSSASNLLSAWPLIDFNTIIKQVTLVTNCAPDLVSHCFDEFYVALSNLGSFPMQNLANFADWALANALPLMSASDPKDSQDRTSLLKWNYTMSQIMRDIAMKSNPASGTLSLISLFIEDWLAYKILKKAALHISPIVSSVESEVTGISSHLSSSAGIHSQGSPVANFVQPVLSNGFSPVSGIGMGMSDLSVSSLTCNFASLLSPTTGTNFSNLKPSAYLGYPNGQSSSSSLTYDDLILPESSPARNSASHSYSSSYCSTNSAWTAFNTQI